MSKIDTKKIMKEVETEVSKKMKNEDYVKDLYKVDRMGEQNFVDLSEDYEDMYSLSYLSKKIRVPRSTKSGIFSRLANKVLIKIYYVVSKMLAPVLESQEHLNKEVIDDLQEIKMVINLSEKADFPYKEYFEKVKENFGIKVEDGLNLNKFLIGKKTIGVLGFNISEFLKYLQTQNFEHISGNDINFSQKDLVRSEKLAVENIEYLSFLQGRNEKEFESIILLDFLEYYSYSHVFSILKEAKRVLASHEDFVVRILNPDHEEAQKRRFDPNFKQFISLDVLKFMLEFLKFEDVSEMVTKLTMNGKYYVVSAKKN